MERYNIQRDYQQLVITKGRMAYALHLVQGSFVLLVPLFLLVPWWHNPRLPPHAHPPVFLAIPTVAFVAVGLYPLWKMIRGGDKFVFNAQMRLFERNGRVVSHWDGIAHLVVVDVPHRQRRSGLLALMGEDEFRHTYRLVAQFSNGKKHVLDECGSRQAIETLAHEIGSYANLPVTSDVANVNWLG